MTLRTSILILLNSSKQQNAPFVTRPLKKRPITIKSMASEQLKTTINFAKALPRSFTVSVLPVPAGPAGAHPKLNYIAFIIVIMHLSVRGVITNLVVLPKYS